MQPFQVHATQKFSQKTEIEAEMYLVELKRSMMFCIPMPTAQQKHHFKLGLQIYDLTVTANIILNCVYNHFASVETSKLASTLGLIVYFKLRLQSLRLGRDK